MRSHLVFALLALFASTTATPARAADFRRGWIELGLGPIDIDSSIDFGHELVAVARGGVRLTDRWAIEAAFFRLDHDSAYSSVTGDSLDVSLRYTVSQGDRWRIFLVTGPGYSEVDYDYSGPVYNDPNGFPINLGRSEEGYSLHLGIGVEIDLSERWYLRPELRRRWTEHDLEGDQSQGTLALGFRF